MNHSLKDTTKLGILFGILAVAALAMGVEAQEENLCGEDIDVIVADEPQGIEQYAIDQLIDHVAKVTGVQPRLVSALEVEALFTQPATKLIVVGIVSDHPFYGELLEMGAPAVPAEQQGYAIWTGRLSGSQNGWCVGLFGNDPLGLLYAVRDFSHCVLYREKDEVHLNPVSVTLAPKVKARVLSESGANLLGKSTYNDHTGARQLNTYFLDWLSEWKVTHLLVWWCNQSPDYDALWKELVPAAHARGIQVLRGFVPFRPDHEGAPPNLAVYQDSRRSTEPSNCPRDPEAREWYKNRLLEVAGREPRIDGLVIESPYHDGVCCTCPLCRENPIPETDLMDNLFKPLREAYPRMILGRCIKRAVPDTEAAAKLLEELKPLDACVDWYYNTYPDRADRIRWHDLGSKCGTYLRTFREVLKGDDPEREINALFDDLRPANERRIAVHGFCYRFYAGRYGSFPVEQDAEMMRKYPEARGPFSLALTAEALFDPFVEGTARERKLARIRALTIPDFPRSEIKGPDREAICMEKEAAAELQSSRSSGLFRYEYSIPDNSFCGAQVCADFDGDGRREIVFASRGKKQLSLLDASSGKAVWVHPIQGEQQGTCAFDVDGDGFLEILHLTSNPGCLLVLDRNGNVLHTWDSGDSKLGNTPVIFDADGDGTLDAYLGSRYKSFFRLTLPAPTVVARRDSWIQCGCHTSAMDVDGDGKWDIFASTGDDYSMEGTLHRLNPSNLSSVWSYPVADNASSADPVLVDLNGDGQVEIVKSVDNYAKDDSHEGVYAFDVNGHLLWKVEQLAGEDTPNVADLDGDGSQEIVGMTYGNEIYCLNAQGGLKWRRDLRPELDDTATAYMAPILCDIDGEPGLEILAMTNGGYFDENGSGEHKGSGIVFALSATGEILDQFDVGAPRFWGEAFYCNIDDDPQMELVVSGSGGFDVIETKGLGPATEYLQRRISYQRLNVVPWAYEDTYFLDRIDQKGLTHRADSLILARQSDRYGADGRFRTRLLAPPGNCRFGKLTYMADVPAGSSLIVNAIDESGNIVKEGLASGSALGLTMPIRIEFRFFSPDGNVTPVLHEYSLCFGK